MGGYTKIRAVWLWACVACWSITRENHFYASLSAFQTLALAASLSLQLLGYNGTTPLLSTTIALSAAKASNAATGLILWPLLVSIMFAARTSGVLL
jgi:hypothetical protein